MGNRYHLTASEGVGLVSEKERSRRVLIPTVYPLIASLLLRLSGRIVYAKEFDLELALKSSIRTLVSRSVVLPRGLSDERIWQGIFKREKDLKLWLRFVGYSSSLMFALNIVLMLLPEFFLRYLSLYILYCLGRR